MSGGTTSDRLLNCYRNGNSGLNFELKLRRNYKAEDVINEIQKRLNLTPLTGSKSYRFFNQDGVEMSISELDLLNDNEKLFVSEGEDFDQISMLAEYKIIKMLGQGGFGKVMLATHRQTGKEVAIKIVNAGKFGHAKDVDMIFSETETLKSLNHDNIVKILNCFNLKDMNLAFVMEYLEGGELYHLVRQNKRLPEKLARNYFRQLTEAISYCHRKKLIHRDLKLENILLVSKNSETIKVVDFGVAGMSSEIKIDGEAGSLRYMPPEILSGASKHINPALDIWAMGCILFGMVCGELPFNGDTNREIIGKICRAEFKFPAEVEKTLSYEVKDLIRKILVTDPKERYTAKDISAHPWMLEEKIAIEESTQDPHEESKEKKTQSKVTKPLAKHGRSESVNFKNSTPKTHSPQSTQNHGATPKIGEFVRSGSGGIADAWGQNKIGGHRNTITSIGTGPVKAIDKRMSVFSKR